MPIPKHKDKFESVISLTPKHLFLKSNNAVDLSELPKAPEVCIMSPSTKIKEILSEKLELKTGPNIIRPIMMYEDKLAVFSDFVGFGAPMWSWVFEQLIFWGVKKFVFIGFFGKILKELDNNDIYVVEKALKDEGTSYHYSNDKDDFSYPSEELNQKFIEKGCKTITIWTIDTMFRQTLLEIESGIEKKIAGFEMETSALFTIAKVKGVELSSVQIISDYFIDGEYKSIYRSDDFNKNLKKAVDISLDVFGIN